MIATLLGCSLLFLLAVGVLSSLRLSGLRSDDWDVMAAKQRQRWDAEREQMGFRK